MSGFSGHVAIAMSGISAFSSMFMGGRPKFSKSNSAKMRVKGGGRSRRSSGRDSGVGGDGARRAVGVDTSTLAGRGGRRGRFVSDQFGRMFADENNVARGISARHLRNEILIFLEMNGRPSKKQ